MRSINDLKDKLIILVALAVACAAMYLSEVRCIVRETLGTICPACGMTRALISLLEAKPLTALRYHPMVWSVPILFVFFLYDGTPFRSRALNAALLTVIAIGFVCVWVLRFCGVLPPV